MFFDASGSGKTEKTRRLQACPKPLLLHNLPKIAIHNSQRDLPISKLQMRKAVSFLIQDLNIETDEVILHFVTEAKICELHKDFFDDPSPTDCITFPLDPPGSKTGMPHVLGEAFICPKTAIAYAKQLKISPEEELLRYVVHCILHLIGYEDTEPSLRKKMKRKENACLQKLKSRL